MYNYSDLQSTIDKVVGTLGVDNTIFLLKGLIGHLENVQGSLSKNKQHSLRSFVTARVTAEFDVSIENLSSSDFREYNEARMVLFHLLYKYGKMSYGIIGEHLGNRPKYSVKYFVGRCDDLLSIPNANSDFYRKYQVIERDLIQYLSQTT